MTFACNMFISAGLAGAAGVVLLPALIAIVSPVFVPHSCSQVAGGMVKPRWESGAGEATHAPQRKPKKRVPERGNPWGTIPWDAARPALGPSCSHCVGSDLGDVGGMLMAEHKCSLDQCLLLTLETSWLYSSEGTKITPWSPKIFQVMDEKGIHVVLRQKLLL